MKKFIISGLALVFPLMAMAAVSIETIIGRVSGIVNLIIPVLGSIAFAIFIWGIIKFIYSGGSEDKKTEAKNYIIYGLIGMFVLVAMWGIFQIVLATFFGGSQGTPLNLPQAPSSYPPGYYY